MTKVRTLGALHPKAATISVKDSMQASKQGHSICSWLSHKTSRSILIHSQLVLSRTLDPPQNKFSLPSSNWPRMVGRPPLLSRNALVGYCVRLVSCPMLKRSLSAVQAARKAVMWSTATTSTRWQSSFCTKRNSRPSNTSNSAKSYLHSY